MESKLSRELLHIWQVKHLNNYLKYKALRKSSWTILGGFLTAPIYCVLFEQISRYSTNCSHEITSLIFMMQTL